MNQEIDTPNATIERKDVDLTLDARYMLTEHWALGLRVGAGYLMGDAADSPVTQERVQPYSIMSVVYRF